MLISLNFTFTLHVNWLTIVDCQKGVFAKESVESIEKNFTEAGDLERVGPVVADEDYDGVVVELGLPERRHHPAHHGVQGRHHGTEHSPEGQT